MRAFCCAVRGFRRASNDYRPAAHATISFFVRRIVGTVAAILLLAAALHAQSSDLDRARAELVDAEIAYEKTLMLYPGCGSPTDDFEQAVRDQA